MSLKEKAIPLNEAIENALKSGAQLKDLVLLVPLHLHKLTPEIVATGIKIRFSQYVEDCFLINEVRLKIKM